MKEELKVQPVGKVLKTFGSDGEVLIKISSDLQEKEPLFIEIDELMVPFFIKQSKERGDKDIVTFRYMETEALAKELVGKIIHKPEQSVTETVGEYDFMMSFTVIDQNLGEIGIITDFYDYPSNPCLEIEHKKNRILIPINNKFIIEVDMDKKTVQTNLPSGILDISLEE